jgi:hypothetical protein
MQRELASCVSSTRQGFTVKSAYEKTHPNELLPRDSLIEKLSRVFTAKSEPGRVAIEFVASGPGTGKTSVVVAAAYKAMSDDEDTSVIYFRPAAKQSPHDISLSLAKALNVSQLGPLPVAEDARFGIGGWLMRYLGLHSFALPSLSLSSPFCSRRVC